MPMMDKDRKCAHSGCACPADPGSDYCSPKCQSAKSASSDAQCPCGHPACQEPDQPTRGGTPRGSYDPVMRAQDKEKPLMDDWGQSDKH
jgi:hypothetical protein